MEFNATTIAYGPEANVHFMQILSLTTKTNTICAYQPSVSPNVVVSKASSDIGEEEKSIGCDFSALPSALKLCLRLLSPEPGILIRKSFFATCFRFLFSSISWASRIWFNTVIEVFRKRHWNGIVNFMEKVSKDLTHLLPSAILMLNQGSFSVF